MQRERRRNVPVPQGRQRSMGMTLSPENAQKLDATQSLINATNPEGGFLSKVDVLLLGLDLLYRKVANSRSKVKEAVKEIAMPRKRKKPADSANGNGTANGSASVDEGECDLEQLANDHKADGYPEPKRIVG